MTEKFSNQAVTALSAAITAPTAASCTVIDATAFPTSGNFRIKIDAEILIVTAVAGNTFTIVRGAEGTAAVTHAASATVIHLLTKGGLEARVANRFIFDLYANKPAAGIKGRLFLPTDGLYLEYDDGAAWHKYGPYRRLKAPPQSGWSWVNQGNATATFIGSALVLEDPDMDAVNPQLRLYIRSLAPGSTTITVAFTFNGIASADAPILGFCSRQIGGTQDGYFSTLGIRLAGSTPSMLLHCRSYTSPTVLTSSATYDGRNLFPQRFMWLKWSWEGDKKRSYYSLDGINWIRWTDDNFGSNNYPSQFGIFIDPTNNIQKVSMSLVHWEES